MKRSKEGTTEASAPKIAARRITTKRQKAQSRPQTKPAIPARSGKEIVGAMAKDTGQPQTVVRSVLQSLEREVMRDLRPRGSGMVTIPELNVRLRRYAKPATKPRKGWNPATREPMTYPAKPARITVRARALKRLRDQIGAATS